MTYYSTVAADNPSNWWRLADPGGIIAQDIGGATPHAPLYVPGAASSPYLGPSSDGAATAKAGTSASLYNILNPIPLLNLWTIETWAWLFSRSANQGIMSLDQVGGGGGCAIRYNAAGTLIGFIVGSSVATYATVTAPGAWHHFALTYDHVTLRLYLDGAQVASVAVVVSTSYSVSPRVGEEATGANLSTGFFADAAYYNATLSAAQLLAHYNAADQRTSTPLYLGGGTYDVTIGASGGIATDLSNVYRAVHKTYV